MKRASHLLCVLLLFTTAFAQQLTQADRDKGVAYLQQTEDGVAKAIKGLSEGAAEVQAGTRPVVSC